MTKRILCSSTSEVVESRVESGSREVRFTFPKHPGISFYFYYNHGYHCFVELEDKDKALVIPVWNSINSTKDCNWHEGPCIPKEMYTIKNMLKHYYFVKRKNLTNYLYRKTWIFAKTPKWQKKLLNFIWNCIMKYTPTEIKNYHNPYSYKQNPL